MPILTLNPTKDTHLSSLSQERDVSYGSFTTNFLQYHNDSDGLYSRRMLFQFDLSAIAPGSTISASQLTLFSALISFSSSIRQFFAYKMTYNDWIEGCTWNSPNPPALWPETYETAGPATGARNDYDPTTQLLPIGAGLDLIAYAGTILSGWILDAVNNNAGILSIYIFGTETHTNFPEWVASRSHSSASKHPKLQITFEPPSHALTLTEGSNGSCTASPDQPAYQEGDVVTLTVTPDAGYAFDGWSGDDAGDVVGPAGDGTYTITMDADKAIQCDFAASTFKLTLNEGVNGTDTLTPNGAEPLHTYEVNEQFLSSFKPDAGFQLDQVAVISGDFPNSLAKIGQAGDGYEWIAQLQKLTQDSEWTSSYKALWTLTTTIVGGAHGTVSRGSGILTWPQEPLYAFVFPHIVRILPDVGYQVQVSINAGTIVPVELTPLSLPVFGFDANDWLFTVPDSDATLTVTWILIAAEQSAGGLWHKPWDDDRGRLIL